MNATIYSILQAVMMSNLKTKAQLSAVEQSFNVHLPLPSLKRCCCNVTEYQSNFSSKYVSIYSMNTEFISALHIIFLWCSDCILPSAVSLHTHNRLLCARPAECCEMAGQWDSCMVRMGVGG